MMETLRSGVGSWFAKGLMGLVVVAMVAWGVGDMLRGRTQGALARVGSVDISQSEYAEQYRRELDELRRRFRGQLTPAQARILGIEEKALTRLVSTAAMDQHAKSLGLSISEGYVLERLKTLPGFARPDGQLDETVFNLALKREGFTRPRFFAARIHDEVRAQLQEAVIAGATVPQAMIDILFKHRDETRTVSHFTIDVEKALKIPQPTDDQIKQVYETNKRQFVVPEQRKLAILLLTVDDVKGTITISDADVEATFTRERPERRKIQQIAFKDKAAAEAAKAEIAAGKSFADVAKAAGATEADIEIGTFAKVQMLDQKVAEAAFMLANEAVSDVIVGTFATVLVRATIVPAEKGTALADVAPQIRDRLAREAAANQIQKLHDDIDKLRLEAKPLKDIAPIVKARLIEIAAIDARGAGPDGKPASDDKHMPLIAAAAFQNKIGAETEAIDVRDGYAWLDVLGSTPERQKTIDEVKDDAKALWEDGERRRQLSSLGAKLVDRLAKGETMEALSAEVGGKVEVARGIKRFGKQPGFSDAAIQQAFILAKGHAGSSESPDGKTRTIVRVDEIAAPVAPNPAEVAQVRLELGRQVEGDLMIAYVDALKQKLGVKIDEQARRRAIGGDIEQ